MTRDQYCRRQNEIQYEFENNLRNGLYCNYLDNCKLAGYIGENLTLRIKAVISQIKGTIKQEI